MKPIDPIVIQGRNSCSTIRVGESLANLGGYLPKGRTIIITDQRVADLYRNQFPPADVITIGCGEKIKTLATAASIYDQLIDLEADRETFIVGIGGGIVGDVTGFAASTYMRGLKFGFVATTLLAQVDATVGGKNGVNVAGYKNMVGLFNQPDFVIADIALLESLPPEEIACGLAEIVKHGCIASADYFHFIEAHSEAILRLDREVMTRLVRDSIAIKAAVVNRDERESGERRKLNFGHTLGHAFEKTLGISHGAAVSAGMAAAAGFSLARRLLGADDHNRLIALLERLKLPVRLDYDRDAVFSALKKDKKRDRDQLHFVLLEGLGKAVIQTLPLTEIERWLGSPQAII
jgi:3-dehydroquinate synthase